jgi:hypothetical protein
MVRSVNDGGMATVLFQDDVLDVARAPIPDLRGRAVVTNRRR